MKNSRNLALVSLTEIRPFRSFCTVGQRLYQNVNVAPLIASQMAVQPPRFWQFSASLGF